MAGGRGEPALQGDLGVYGVGESPSFSSPGLCHGLKQTHPSDGPLLEVRAPAGPPHVILT